ncbi:hypothetical protein RvY_16307, partial [Ramazzottius varieornatus]
LNDHPKSGCVSDAECLEQSSLINQEIQRRKPCEHAMRHPAVSNSNGLPASHWIPTIVFSSSTRSQAQMPEASPGLHTRKRFLQRVTPSLRYSTVDRMSC